MIEYSSKHNKRKLVPIFNSNGNEYNNKPTTIYFLLDTLG